MINPRVEEHPNCELSESIREAYPTESLEWRRLLEMARNPEKRGCFTCMHYSPISHEFVDIEGLDDESQILPWDSEAAWINCDKFQNEDTPLTIECPLWVGYNSN